MTRAETRVLLALAAGWGALVLLRSKQQPVAGALCNPLEHVPRGWLCEQREIDGAYVLRQDPGGQECDPLELPIPGYVCVPAGDAFVLRPEAP